MPGRAGSCGVGSGVIISLRTGGGGLVAALKDGEVQGMESLLIGGVIGPHDQIHCSFL